MAEMIVHRFVKHGERDRKVVSIVECGATDVLAVAYSPENVTCRDCRIIDAEESAYYEKEQRERLT